MSEQWVIDEALAAGFAQLGEPGSLGEELSDEELLVGLFDEHERAAFETRAQAEGPLATPAKEPRSASEAVPPRARTRRVRRVWAPFAAIGLIAAACAVLLSVDLLRPGLPARAESVDRKAGVGAAMASTPERPLRWAHPGERHRLHDNDCRRLAGDMSVCSPESASFRVGEDSTATAIELELESGELELDGQDSSFDSLELRTAIGRIIVRDPTSRFRVMYDTTRRRLNVEVLAGVVTVERDDGERVNMGAGARLGLEQDPPRASSPAEPVPAPDIGAKPDKSGFVPKEPDTGKTVVAPPEQLLTTAQRELAAGDRPTAMRSYRILIERFPDSVEGRTARISLGRLLLATGDTSAALVEFEKYLDGHDAGPLLEEARYGRIRCLQALGRTAELHTAIDDFEARYPTSLHHERLAKWRTDQDESPGL